MDMCLKKVDLSQNAWSGGLQETVPPPGLLAIFLANLVAARLRQHASSKAAPTLFCQTVRTPAARLPAIRALKLPQLFMTAETHEAACLGAFSSISRGKGLCSLEVSRVVSNFGRHMVMRMLSVLSDTTGF